MTDRAGESRNEAGVAPRTTSPRLDSPPDDATADALRARDAATANLPGELPDDLPGDPSRDLHLVFAALPRATAVFAADAPRFTVLAVSDALVAASHRTRDALVGRAMEEAFPSASRTNPAADGPTTLRASLDATVRTGAPQRMPRQRYDLERPDGVWEERYWDAVNVPVLGSDGAVRYVLHETEDVTARVLSDAAVARAEHRAGALLARIADAYIVLDRDFRFVDVNPAAERSMGKTREELVGRSHWEVFPASHDIAAGVNYRRAAREGVELHFTQHYAHEGYDVHLELDAYPVDDGGVAVLWRDVTARVRAEEERERLLAETEAARLEAAAASQAKSGFLATMSHELRTPVNAVIGYAQLLELGLAGPLTEQQRAYLERLARSSHHLLGLVDDVLDLSKIEAGETRILRADGTTGPPVGAALDVVAPAAAARGVRLVDARAEEAGVPFVGDEDRVRQVVVNLLSNAVKFTAPGGTVTVTSETVRTAPPAATHLRGDGPWALVRVADTGVGIAPEEQGRIFEPFHQVEGGHTRTVGGTGLGLAISRQLARLMGGDLSVESVPGVGSAFTLWLAAARQQAGQPDETAVARSVRAERALTRLEAPGLGEVGALLHERVPDVMRAYTDRLRADPAIPRGAAMTRIQLEDHAISFLADLAQSLVIVGDAGREAVELLKDGSAIQRAIAEAHGARRHAQGWAEAALRRDQQIFREEVERAVRAGLKPGSGAVDDAVHVLLGLVGRGEAIAVRAWRRAATQVRR
ncbi:MAG TPA: ATP-binding protein [Gemmatirosa sp.]|nr:ATP-binding protein [Gemmatirosa sp.]